MLKRFTMSTGRLVSAVCILGLLYFFFHLHSNDVGSLKKYLTSEQEGSSVKQDLWSIMDASLRPLLDDAASEFEIFRAGEVRDKRLKAIVNEYKRKRGRAPPPRFDLWVEFALERNVVMIEAFFDQIYHDLTPFWTIPSETLRAQAHGLWRYESARLVQVLVREGRATAMSDFWRCQTFASMLDAFSKHLPDMDILVNQDDEPRIVVKYDDMVGKMKQQLDIVSKHKLQKSLDFAPYEEVHKEQELKACDGVKWDARGGMPTFDFFSKGCPATSPSSTASLINNFLRLPAITGQYKAGYTNAEGFISNWTKATDLCSQPDLQYLHGLFIAPTTMTGTHDLVPIFSECKVSTNNDILFPA